MKADCCCLCWHEIKKYIMQYNCSDTRIFKCDCKKLWIMNKQKTSHSTTNKKIPILRTILVHHKFKLQTKLKVKSMKLRYSLGIYSLFFLETFMCNKNGNGKIPKCLHLFWFRRKWIVNIIHRLETPICALLMPRLELQLIVMMTWICLHFCFQIECY